MTEADKTPETEAAAVGSAPELPLELSRKFGLDAETGIPASPTANAEADEALEGSVTIDDMGTDEDVDAVASEEKLALRKAQEARGDNKILALLRRLHAAWRSHKRIRWLVLAAMVITPVVVTAVPASRYFVLNAVGVRSTASVVAVDELTRLPLKNVTVQLGSEKRLTDRDGKARFDGLKLGRYALTVKRLAFAPHEASVVIGWGSNPLGPFGLRATGVRYTVLVTDFLSGKPIRAAEVDSDEANALTNEAGEATLAIANKDITTLEARVGAAGYRTDTVVLDISGDGVPKIRLVPAGKTVFVTKQSGKYDVVAMDIDGKNSQVLVPGTGGELADINLVVKPDGSQAALVSTREGTRDEDGYLLRSLTLINVTEGTFTVVDRAEQLQLIDWLGDRLVYRITVAGASAADPQRSRIIAYNPAANARLQLANANQFNAIISARGSIYYAMSSTDPAAILGLFVIKPDGSGKSRLSSDEVWTGLRAAHDTFHLQTPDTWVSYDINSRRFTSLAAQPRVVTYSFVDEPSGTPGLSVWLDTVDGRKTLLLYDIAKKTNKTVHAQDGMTGPIRWLGSRTIIYRVATNAETADYAVSIDGGNAYKISDVATTFGYVQPF